MITYTYYVAELVHDKKEEAISELPGVSVSKRALIQNLSYKSDLNLHENEPKGGSYFHRNGFALRLVLIQRQKATRKCPILIGSLSGLNFVVRATKADRSPAIFGEFSSLYKINGFHVLDGTFR